ncbi:MAG TPA: FAD-dependent oxidoreductase [Synergistaceae bacterium]|nr:FAD-dependent oxidoreductase [Synergistaceae bacterium]
MLLQFSEKSSRSGGADVTLLERTDMLLGTGLVGGIFRNNGRFTAAEELLAMGGEMFSLLDTCARHKNIEFPGHAHASLYDVYEMEPAILGYLKDLGVNLRLQASASGLTKKDGRITSVTLRNGDVVEGDVFVDTTGTSATPAYCMKHGNGCAMCILRCHSFAPRWSLTSQAGVEE